MNGKIKKSPVLKGSAGALKGTTMPPNKAVAKKEISLRDFRVQVLILAIIGFIFYANTFTNGSAFDDRMAITANEYVQRGFAGIPDILTKDAYQSYLEQKNGSNQLAGGRYRPLSLITFAIEQQLLGVHDDDAVSNSNEKQERMELDMHTRHVVNVLLYILSVIALLSFLRKIVFPAQPLIAFTAALLFMIHPIHTEVVANVKSRDEILSVLFISLTFICAFKYRDSKKKRDLWLALGAFFLALLSKEYAVTMVLLLPLSFYIFRKEPIGNSVKASLPFLIPVGIYLLMRFAAVSAVAQGAENNVLNNPYLYATGAQKIATEILVLLDYLKLLFYPNPLICDYSYRQIPYTDFGNPLVWVSIGVYLFLIAAMCVLFMRRHVLCFAIALFLLPLFLVSNILFNIGAPMGERLIYHSSIGFSMAVAWLLFNGFERLKQPSFSSVGMAGILVALVMLCGFKTVGRNEDWKNDTTLFLTDVKTAPNSVLINNNAGAASMSLAKAGDGETRKEWFEKATGYFDKAISIYPGDMQGYMNRGLCYFDMGAPGGALQDWDTARKYDPARQNLARYLAITGKYFLTQGIKYQQSGQIDSAILSFQKSTEATPEVAEGWYRLGGACYAAGRKEDALGNLEKALQIAPADAEIRRLYEEVKVK